MQAVQQHVTGEEEASALSAPLGARAHDATARARAEANKQTVLDFYESALNQSRFMIAALQALYRL